MVIVQNEKWKMLGLLLLIGDFDSSLKASKE